MNVPVVCVAREVMILMRANPIRGPLEGVGPEMTTSEAPHPYMLFMIQETFQ